MQQKLNRIKKIAFYRVYRISLSEDNSDSYENESCAMIGKGGCTNGKERFGCEPFSSVSCFSREDQIAEDLRGTDCNRRTRPLPQAIY